MNKETRKRLLDAALELIEVQQDGGLNEAQNRILGSANILISVVMGNTRASQAFGSVAWQLENFDQWDEINKELHEHESDTENS